MSVPIAPTSSPPPTPLATALYVHVPFCVSKCAYCDFASAVGDERWHTPYVDAVLYAADHWSSYDVLDDVASLYIGGGTPTLLGAELVRLITGLRELAGLRVGAEVTVETNPETTDQRGIAALAAAGVNRFSLGVQSFDDAVLGTLGRRHSVACAVAAADVLERSGQRFSVDLICGVPGQSTASWRESVERAIATRAAHVSVYPLSIEEGTPLARAIDEGRMSEPDPDAAAEMMELASALLGTAGLDRYEVANYARPGEESRHNSSYWTGLAYLGLGPSAASMLPPISFAPIAASEGWEAVPEGAARCRFATTSDTAEWLRNPLRAPAETEYLTARETAREDVMLGMRRSVGVPAEEVAAAGLGAVLESLAVSGLVELARGETGERWRPTARGWLLGNEVFGRIWSGE